MYHKLNQDTTIPSIFGKFRQPAYYYIKLGEQLVIALNDGTVSMQMNKLLGNISEQALSKILADNFLANTLSSSVNAYLLQIDGITILIDTGAGDLMGSNSGHLLHHLISVGIRAEDVDVILLSHIHADHTGGLTSNGKRSFPNAIVYVHQADVDYWLNEENMYLVAPERRQSFKNAVAKVQPYQDNGKLRTFTGTVSLFRGLSTLPSPGHTPGHTHYVLENNGEKMVFCGDIAHVPLIQFAMPEVSIFFDVDANLARSSREQALSRAAEEGYWLASAHASFPGVGHVRNHHGGYSWHPINYSIDGSDQ
jgi:glyoxylase-like metal-dependent hydrolase (beta-lactamase superfamily II)